MRLKVKRYLIRNVIALDQLANAILGGDPKETISDSLYRHQREGSKAARKFCAWLSKVLREPDHCRKSHERKLALYREAIADEQ